MKLRVMASLSLVAVFTARSKREDYVAMSRNRSLASVMAFLPLER